MNGLTALAGRLHRGTGMSEKREAGGAAAMQAVAVSTMLGTAVVDDVRCSVCDRMLLRMPRDGRSRAVMVKCRHCGALQHRRL